MKDRSIQAQEQIVTRRLRISWTWTWVPWIPGFFWSRLPLAHLEFLPMTIPSTSSASIIRSIQQPTVLATPAPNPPDDPSSQTITMFADDEHPFITKTIIKKGNVFGFQDEVRRNLKEKKEPLYLTLQLRNPPAVTSPIPIEQENKNPKKGFCPIL